MPENIKDTASSGTQDAAQHAEAVKLRMHEVCTETMADLERRGTPGWRELQAWRQTVAAGFSASEAEPTQRELNKQADKPRQIYDLLKEEIQAQKQDELLNLIRGAPGWGFDQSQACVSGTLLVFNTIGARQEDDIGLTTMSRLTDSLLWRCGGAQAISNQRWRQRYVVLTPETLELYCDGGTGVATGGGKPARLERTLQMKLADTVEILQTDLSFEAEALRRARQQRSTESQELAAAGQQGSRQFKVVFRDPTDAWSPMVELSLIAESASEASEWVTAIQKMKDTAIDASVLVEDADREQHILDELCEAFAALSTALDLFLEKVVLPPPAMQFLVECCSRLTASSISKLQAAFEAVSQEPQSAPVFDIKPKLRSATDWVDAVALLTQMCPAANGEIVQAPSMLASQLLAVIDSIYATFQEEQAAKGKDGMLGADDLLPIIVFVLAKSNVSKLPVIIEMVSRTADQNSKAAYYSITVFSALQYICHQLVPASKESTAASDAAAQEPEPELDLQTAVADGEDAKVLVEIEIVEVDSYTPKCGTFACVLADKQLLFYGEGELGQRPCVASVQLQDVRQLIVHPNRPAFMVHSSAGYLSHFRLAGSQEVTESWTDLLAETVEAVNEAAKADTAAISPMPRTAVAELSPVLRGTFMVADGTAEEAEHRRILMTYAAVVLHCTELADEGSDLDEKASTMSDDERWEVVKAHAQKLHFGEELACRALMQRIVGEMQPPLGESGSSAATILARLLSGLPHGSGSGDALDSVLERVAKHIKVEYPTTRQTYDDSTSVYTQYRMEVHLFSWTWTLSTRWSALEAFEKQTSKFFEGRKSDKKLLPKLKKGGHKVGSSLRNVKTWVKPTDSNLVDDRRIALHQYANKLFRFAAALSCPAVLGFAMPDNLADATDDRHVSISDAIGQQDDQSLDDQMEEQALDLPERCSWDEGWGFLRDAEACSATKFATGCSLYQDADALNDDGASTMGLSSSNKMIARLTSCMSMDVNFASVFLATYRSFWPPIVLLMKLWERVLVPEMGSPGGELLMKVLIRNNPQAVEEKCAQIFSELDVDLDGKLNCSEVQQLAVRTGGSLSEEMYAQVCKKAGCNPAVGLSRTGLLRVYTDLKMGNVEKDFYELGLKSENPTLDRELHDGFQSTVQTKVFLAVRQWLLEYYQADFADDLQLQRVLRGFIMTTHEQQECAEAFREGPSQASQLIEAWTWARRADAASGGSVQKYREFFSQTARRRHVMNFAPVKTERMRGAEKPPPPILPQSMLHLNSSGRNSTRTSATRRSSDRLASMSVDARSLFTIDPQELARQIALSDFNHYSHVTIYDLIGGSWSDISDEAVSKRAQAAGACNNRAGRQGQAVVDYVHFSIDLGRWVVTSIVVAMETDAASPGDLDRTKVMWLTVGQHLLQLKVRSCAVDPHSPMCTLSHVSRLCRVSMLSSQ